MPSRWKHDEGDLEVNLDRDDRDNRRTTITIRDTGMQSETVIQPYEARWLIERLGDAIAAANEHQV